MLIAPPDFELEEAAKAAHLGVNGIVGADLADKKELYRLEELIRRYRPVEDKRTRDPRGARRGRGAALRLHAPGAAQPRHGQDPRDLHPGASFKPGPGSVVADLEAGCRVPACSLKLADEHRGPVGQGDAQPGRDGLPVPRLRGRRPLAPARLDRGPRRAGAEERDRGSARRAGRLSRHHIAGGVLDAGFAGHDLQELLPLDDFLLQQQRGERLDLVALSLEDAPAPSRAPSRGCGFTSSSISAAVFSEYSFSLGIHASPLRNGLCGRSYDESPMRAHAVLLHHGPGHVRGACAGRSARPWRCR